MATEEAEARPAQYVGASLPRVEDPRFLKGRAKFVDDIQLPGMLHAALLRSSHAHARIVSIDTTKAKQLDGVAEVLIGADVEEFPAFVAQLPREEVQANSRRILPIDKVRFVGEPVAIVAATSRYIAEDAAALIDVEYEPLPAILDPQESLKPDAPILHEDSESNNFAHIEYEKGDVEKAFAEADRVFSKRFHHGRFHAAPLETRGIVADYEPGSGSFTMWTSSSVPHLTRSLLAHSLGLHHENQLRVVAPDVGGSFGLKIHLFPEDALVPYLARQTGRPVKWIEDRYENLAASTHAKEVIIDLEVATTNDGKFLAIRGRFLGDAGAFAAYPWTPLVDPMCAGVMMPSLYDIPVARFEADAAYTNKSPTGAYRGVGWTSGQTAREVLIDEIARELDIDPVDLRLKNTIPNDPYESATGCKYDGGSYAEAQKRAAAAVDYEAFRKRQEELRKEGRYIGVGFSPFLEPGGWSGDMAKRMGFPFDYMDAATVTMEPDGSVTVTLGLHSHGQAHETTFAQLVADRLGVKVESVKIVEGDTAATAYGLGTWGSRSAVIGGGSITRAAEEVREKIIAIAAHAMEASPADIELYDGNATVKGSPDKSMPMLMIGFTAYFGAFVGGTRPPGIDPALTATRSYEPPESYGNGCIAMVVEVDAETGEVEIEKVAAIGDCGVMLNPMVVDGQLAGATAQGIGGALYEDLPYDENGQFLAGTLLDYLYPSTMEIPPIEIDHIETPSTVTEGGIKGAGEGGTIAAPAAVAAAVADALSPLGVSVDRTPLGPSRVVTLIDEATE